MTDHTTPIGPQPPPRDDSYGDAPRESTPRSTRSGSRRRRVDPTSEWFWPLINLIGLIAVVAVNALANIIPFNGLTTGEVINRDPIYFQPAGWTFAIWGVIYLLLLAFVIYSLLPIGRRDLRVRRIGPLFLVANLANIVWLVLWHYQQWLASVIVMTVLLISLILIYVALRRRRDRTTYPGRAERLMVWTPFSVYLGWITVAFIANVSIWLDRTGTDAAGISPRWWAVLMILLVLLVTALMAIWRRDPAFTLVAVWALLGIGVEQWDRSLLVAITAIVALLLAAVLTVVASLIAYEQRTIATALPQSVPPKHRSSFLKWGDRSEAGEQGNRHDGEPSS